MAKHVEIFESKMFLKEWLWVLFDTDPKSKTKRSLVSKNGFRSRDEAVADFREIRKALRSRMLRIDIEGVVKKSRSKKS